MPRVHGIGVRLGRACRGALLATACCCGTLPRASDAPLTAGAPPHDVVVIGGTPAGIAAAIAAARMGKTVLIVEQAPVLGGVLSSGVLRLDDKYVESNSGVMDEFRRRVRDHHRSALADDPVVKRHMQERPPSRWNTAEGRAWEPHTAARIFAEMVGEWPSITTRLNEVPVDVELAGDRAVAVLTRDYDNRGRLGAGHRHAGRVIIDATYEADLAAFAGVPFRIGREPRTPEEPHAGLIYSNFFRHVADTLPETILPGSTGAADDRSQAFTYRIVAKDYGRPDHPFRIQSPPPGYDARKYSWNPASAPLLPNSKLDLLGITRGGDLTGHGTRWVLAKWEERAAIAAIHRDHELGWLYYIQTEGKSPHYGLPDDEFVDNDHFPYRLYVRQGRRIEGLATLTESDLHKDLRGNGLRGPLHPDAVAIGLYEIDSHHVQNPTARPEPPFGDGAAEGTLDMKDATGPYQIPYGVMVPTRIRGLLFPVGISCTHVAMCSVRMEPVWSALGQAAGVAAALAIDRGRELADVPVAAIQDELLKQKCLLFFYVDVPGDSPAFEAIQKLSLRGAAGDVGIAELGAFGQGDERARRHPDAYRFRPEDAITRAEFARMLVKGLGIPVSVTASHFHDAPRGHFAFPYLETLYDRSSQSTTPFLAYDVRREGKRTLAFVHPDRPVHAAEAARILAGVLGRDVPAGPEPEAELSRAAAAMLIAREATTPPPAGAGGPGKADVIVYGDASGGVTAAVQAARMGKTVVLVSPCGHLGGMSSSGLGWCDIGDHRILGGLAREFHHRAFEHYQRDAAWVHESRADYGNAGQGMPALNPATELASTFEPKVAESIFDGLAAEAGVRVVRGRLDLDRGVTKDGGRISAIHLEDGRTLAGRVFVDTSYEGDLLAAAGVSFVVGREANAEFGETGNGITGPLRGNQLPKGIDPFVTPGDPASGLLPGVNPDMGGTVGAGDRRLQAYCYRMVLTDVPENRVPIAKPEGYREADYEILFRSIEAGQRKHFFKTTLVPNRKTDGNNTGGISCDLIGGNYGDGWDWTTLGHHDRDRLAARHRDWQLGLVWTLQNHPRVPEAIRRDVARWGLARDEFIDNDHWPYLLYIREGRRMRSDFVMTENHCRGTVAVDDPIGMGAYTLDSHNTQRFVHEGMVRNEGDIQARIPGPYSISYRAIVPRDGECDNLLVPVALSATHIAFGSIRMEPVFMILGQAAGTAAVLALDADTGVQDVPYDTLRRRLVADGLRLEVSRADASAR